MPELPDWTPELEDVAALVASRTGDDDTGDETGTFSDTTRPTAEAVGRLIVFAVGDVDDFVGVPIPERYEDDAHRLATLRVASLIEHSYFEDEQDAAGSSSRQYEAMYLEGVRRLRDRAREGVNRYLA